MIHIKHFLMLDFLLQVDFTKSRIWNDLLRTTGASEYIGCTEPYTDR